MVVHPQVVTDAHLAACAAGAQGKFLEFKQAYWEQGYKAFVDSNYKDMSKLQEPALLEIAKGIGLNVDKLKADMHAPACAKRLADDSAELEKFHVNATPAFFINGREIIGGMGKEDFKAIIDAKLKIAEASGVPAKDYYQKEILDKGEKVFRSVKDPKPAK